MSARRRKCPVNGKGSFRSQGEARRAIEAIAVTNTQAVVPDPAPVPVRAYRCRCGSWHLTVHTLKEKQDRRNRMDELNRRRGQKPRKRRAKTRRTLRIVPTPPAAPPVPAEAQPAASWLPSDPISEARKDHWQRAQAELTQANLANPYPWKRAA